MQRPPLIRKHFITLLLLIIVPACDRAPSPDELQADRMLESARELTRSHRTGEARQTLLALLDLEARLNRSERSAAASELLASSYRAAARFDSAMYYYDQSYAGYRAVADKYAARRVRLEKAALHRQLNEFEQALREVTEMMRISEVLGDVQGTTELNWALIPVHRGMGNEAGEEAAIRALLQVASEAGSLPMEARVYAEWGDAYGHRGEWASAVEQYQRALAIAASVSDSLQEVTIRSRLADAYSHLGDRNEAFRVYTDGLVQADGMRGTELLREIMLVRTGNIYLAGRDYANADRFYEAALQSAIRRNDKLLEGYLFIQRGHCATGLVPGAPDAQRDYQIGLELFRSYSYEPGAAYAHASIGLAALKAGRLQEALTNLSAATALRPNPGNGTGEPDIIAECEKAFAQAQEATPGDAFLDVLLRLGKYEDAFRRSEALRNGEIADVLRKMRIETGRQHINAAVWQAGKSRSWTRGAVIQQRLALSQGAVDQFLHAEILEGIRAYSDKKIDAAQFQDPAGVELLLRDDAPGITKTQELLPPSTALLTWIPTRRTLFLFVIRRDSWSVELAAVERSLFEGEAAEYVALLGEPADENAERGDRTAALRRLGLSLYSRIVRPVMGSLSGVEKLVIIPYDRFFPVHVLPLAGREPRYVVDQFRVSYLPSVSALSLPPHTGSPAGIDIVGLGHPGESAWDVEYELRDIQAFHKPARLYFKENATLATLQRERPSLLHLAAEFNYDQDWPAGSTVLLSDGKTARGSLAVPWGRFFSLPSYGGVIVSDLSAGASIAPVKPLLFLASGTRSVIIISSPAGRKTKKMFGELFYTAFLERGDPEYAYHAAVRGLIGNGEFSAPDVWGPFTLWGE